MQEAEAHTARPAPGSSELGAAQGQGKNFLHLIGCNVDCNISAKNRLSPGTLTVGDQGIQHGKFDT